MANYDTKAVLKTAYEYLGITSKEIEVIPETNDRGLILPVNDSKVVVFIYPISCKQANGRRQDFFDTRSSGVKGRQNAWNYAIKNNLKYFCLGFNDQQDKYKNYILSLESNEKYISSVSSTGVANGRTTGTQANIPNDFRLEKDFERVRTPKGFFISAIKRNRIYEYLTCFDNRPYMEQSDNNLDDAQVEKDEYQRAAEILENHIQETGFTFDVKKDEIEKAIAEFQIRFSPEVLRDLNDDNLLQTIFYTSGDNSNSLCYWVETKPEYREFFGSISGGSAYKFGLFQKKETGIWCSGSPQKPEELTEEEALEFGKKIRDALVSGAELIKSYNCKCLADYEKMDSELWETIGKQFYNWAWFHKYFVLICPEKLSGFHSKEWQYHVLRALKVNPSEQYYARSGQIAMIANIAGLSYYEMYLLIADKFGPIKEFLKLETNFDGQNCAALWEKRSVIGFGFRELGSLADYTSGDGLDKQAIINKLTSLGVDKESQKYKEITRFYQSDANTVFVVMDGDRLLAFVDGIGQYFYDETFITVHLKPGTWHHNFTEYSQLPAIKEGSQSECYQFSSNENLSFLYGCYYYPDEQSYPEEDIEEHNKKMFRSWITSQVKPETDSDAGQPYSSNSIDQYVNNISNTNLISDESHSVFYSNDVEEVQRTLDWVLSIDKKNKTQRSALKKYIEFLNATKENTMPLTFNTSLETEYERNRIVFGAPGTGKSFELKQDSEKFLKGTNGSMERVTFHPDYTYAQFVGTYKPVSEEGSIRYEFVPGPFMRTFVEAIKSGRTDNPQPHILIIEEINRAKVAAVFGDVFQLLDRDDDGVSDYEIQTSEDIRKFLAKELGGVPNDYSRIRIPNNMFIWATMNSADQGVYPMDTAFKRRWSFEYLGINENDNGIRGRVKLGTDESQDIEWNVLRRAINEKLATEYKVNEDKLMGPFFLSKKVLKTVSESDDSIENRDKFIKAFKSKVIMYLYEDAAKQHKHKLFAGADDTTKYSAICESFDKIGIQIFGEDFEEQYYNPQKG